MNPLTCTLRLNTGASIPQFGLGTWQITNALEVHRAITTALDAGYRHLDLASIYGNQVAVGAALKTWLEKNKNEVKRSDIFITSKLWSTEHRPERVEPALRKTLSELQLDYLDLYLVHWPLSFDPNDDPLNTPSRLDKNPPGLRATWKAMGAVMRLGLARSIGVSNFSTSTIEAMVLEGKTDDIVIPAVNQIEIHPLLPQQDMLALCKKHGIVVTAYCPLGSTSGPILCDPIILRISEKWKGTPAQVLLSWGLLRGTVVVPKSATPERIVSNAAKILPLDIDDMQTIECMTTTGGRQPQRYCDPVKLWNANIFSNESSLF